MLRFCIATQPNINWTEFSFLIILTTVLIFVSSRLWEGHCWTISDQCLLLTSLYTFIIFNSTLWFLSLVSRGRACISFPRPKVWSKAFVCLFTALVLSCQRKTWQLSGSLVANSTSHSTAVQKGLHLLPPYLTVFSLKKKKEKRSF